ncbi:diguanylate cyclase domain-containing protein [Dapis sp. BLCC M229]|uniref:diguanylate cyclase domain-containing protein n=1 Tax=Dapis sp. BLCC M229 TaxID=3400188 RepID=UPI003CF98ED9
MDIEAILQFTEEKFYAKTGNYFSDIQRIILLKILENNRYTYEQIADNCRYSAKYLKQSIVPKLWQTISEIFEEKVTKNNFKEVAQQKMQHQLTLAPLPSEKPLNQSVDVNADSPSLSTNCHRGNILLVDDQPQNLNVLSDLLEEQGYEVRQALNGSIALKAVELTLPDVILLDIHMPELDGYAVCQRLKTNPQTQDVTIIFVSALDEAWDKVKAFSVGGADYITKPFKVIEVLARIENQLKIQRLKREVQQQNIQLQQQNIQLQQAFHELGRLGVLDELTQVANRSRFNDYLNREWERAHQNKESLALIFCKIDKFAEYDQSYGNLEKDSCLYKVAQALKHGLQSSKSLLCRYEEAKFGIIVSLSDIPNLEKIAKSLVDEVNQLQIPYSISSANLYITVSIGIASLNPDEQTTSDRLIQLCEQELEKAEAKGSDRYSINQRF